MPEIYEYAYIKQLTKELPARTYLIDVREASEYHGYHLPNSVNMPFRSFPNALAMPDDEFEEIFSFSKPAKSDKLVFYCAIGMRSGAAEEFARELGYADTGNYLGSLQDWFEQEM